MILKIYSVTVTVTIKRGKRKQILKCKNHGHSFMMGDDECQVTKTLIC